MIHISSHQHRVLLQILSEVDAVGPGFLISNLKADWVKRIMARRPDLTEEDARKQADTDALSVAMHEDTCKLGAWDETGERYRKKKAKS